MQICTNPFQNISLSLSFIFIDRTKATTTTAATTMPIVDFTRTTAKGDTVVVRTLSRSTGIPDNRNYVACPYDSEHQMPALRLGLHINECRKKFMAAHGHVDLEACKHNAVHRVAKDGLEKHEKDCKDQTRWKLN